MPEHSNLSVIRRVGQGIQKGNLAEANDALGKDIVWHYFNPRLPELAGDYEGPDGVQSFFQRLGRRTGGSFQVEPVSIHPVGDELVFTHARVHLTLDGKEVATDAVVIWRVLEGRVVEVWDIPAVGAGARVAAT
jgi:uncharacterized protein